MTNTATPDLDLIIRIEKLLAQGSDPGATPEEREAFQAKAAQLIERHRIDRSLIGGHLQKDDVIGTSVVGRFDGVYGRVRINVAATIARAFDCEVFWSGHGNERTLKVYGFKSDRDVIIPLSNRLLADCDLRVQGVGPDEQPDMYNYDNNTYYRSVAGARQASLLNNRRGFYIGYAQAVGSRMMSAKRQAESDAEADGVDVKSAALVLVDRRAQVNEALKTMNMRSAGGISGAGGSGRQAGYAAGSQVSLAHNNAVGGRKAIGR